MEATGRDAAGAVAAGALEAGPAPVEAGPAPIAFFSAALMISSLLQNQVNHRVARNTSDPAYSSRFKQAHAMTHSTQSSFPSPNVCQTFFSSSVFPVTEILVPPPFSGGFLEIFPNWTATHQFSPLLIVRSRAHLYTFRRDLMTCICEIKHCPEIGVGIRFGYLV